MAAFSSSFHQHHTFLLDSSSSLFFLANNNIVDEPNNPFSPVPQFYDHQIQNHHHQNQNHVVGTKVIPSSGPPAISINGVGGNENNINEGCVVSVTNNKNSTTTTTNNTMESSSIVTHDPMHDHCDQLNINNNDNPMDVVKKRRLSKEGSSANTAQSKDKREEKGKKQKKTKKDDEEKKKKAEKEAPTGFIHVRARRGQATDSHSLAERVRREKISERMKLLQAIVPGCDKVTGKALMLDEIINYVQSLQNQVEFLSMKLASVNPMYYDFGMDLDSFMVRPDQDLSNMQDCSPTTANTNYLLVDNPPANSILFQQPHIPNVIPQAGSRQGLWEVDELIRQKNNNQSGLSNSLFSFH